jgi:hypothetical protein
MEMTKPLSEKQLASINRSAQRAKTRNGNGDEKLSLYIRVAESRIYNGRPVLKALLKEVTFLRLTDLHVGDVRIPKGTPWSKDYRLYEGWCFARQEYLANRVGCEPTYASKALKRIVGDGYLKSRKYKGRDGAWHKQYFPDEFAIDSAILELSSASDDKSADKSVASFVGAHLHSVQEATCTNDKRPVALMSGTTCTNDKKPVALSASKEVSGVCLEVGSGGSLYRTPPSGCINGYTPTSQQQGKPNPYGDLSSQAKRKTKPTPQPGYDYCQDCGSEDPSHLCTGGFDQIAARNDRVFVVEPSEGGFDLEEA